MIFSRSDIELMAPVGSYESLMAAIQGGADSVYFGVEDLNMRSRSSVNFTLDDLEKIVAICNEHSVSSYLTLNVVMYNDELIRMKAIVDAAKKHGITAIIAADQSVISYANSVGMEIHISTQVNISNIESLKFYAKFADVMVLARELNLDQIHAIHKQIIEQNICGPSGKLIRLELFIHGALCMSISGKCYLSLHEYNYSANRGACLQTCRRGYMVTDKETGQELEIDNEYIMSPKDLCTIHFLNKILDAGVSVLKIEGRARSPEYVKIVAQCYSEAIESIVNHTYTDEKIEGWQQKLTSVFNRGFWNGYYLGQRLGEWSNVYGSKATKRKIYAAKCTNYFTKLSVAEFLCEADVLNVGDEVIIIGPTTGVVETSVGEIRVELKNVDQVKQGEVFSMPVPQIIRRADKLYKWMEAE
jgi:U32 family peptidase